MPHRRSSLPILLLIAALSFLIPAIPAGEAPTASVAGLMQECVADQETLANFYDLPGSPVRFDRLERLCADWQARLDQTDFAALNQAGRVDFILLQNDLRQTMMRLETERRKATEIAALLPFRDVICAFEQARWRGGPVDGRVAAAKLEELARQTKTLRERIEKALPAKSGDGKKEPPTPTPTATSTVTPPHPLPPVTPVLALRAAGAADELRAVLKRWFEYHDGFQPEASWWLRKPYEGAAKELEDYAKFLREDVAKQKGKDDDPLVGDPVGAAALAGEIRGEFLPYSAEELLVLGERELLWCEEEMKKAARDMGCGDDWKAALEKVKTDFVPPGGQDTLIAAIADEALAFTRSQTFATVPPICAESWRLTMTSPETQKTIPYAAYHRPEMMVAYAKEEMKGGDKLAAMRANNRAFTRLTTFHELIPGHHLQLYQAARNNPQRAAFATPFGIEGWAFYCELRFWQLGWARTPQDRIGMLFWRMNRAARIIVTLRFHLGRMTPDEMVTFLVNRVGHEPAGATAEVRRFIGGGFPPLYQASYMLGGMQLLALHDEALRSGKWNETSFNDAVLREGSIPVELLRAALLDQPLTRDTAPTWKFAGDAPR